ncbi:hypothetical protein PHLCEN_2v10567 [Hermanssonia centrifuga]|uniref:Uncharacterized protein n=1 Tax=Hermanssonia centrifuga TaxID=98765 RepID=A0A2R6NMN1_9APHY|nr:hypothetical protein PHLCEN_2v10567 [Hermanssonia centrifuga]
MPTARLCLRPFRQAPSQLWELVLERNNQDLVLRHTYMPKVPTTFAGLPSIFGGSHDQLILRASTAGDIYVWDRDSATLLHQIHVPTRLGHLTSFAWNRAASDSWMFVTGSHEGAVYIWTTPTDEVPGLSFPLPLVSTPDSMSRSSRPWSLSRAGTTSTYGFGEHTESPLGHGIFADRNRRTRSTFTEDSEVTMGDNDSPMRSGFRRVETFS